MTNETDSFVQEVDESLRQDQLLTVVRRYGVYLISAFVALLLGLVGWQLWTAHQQNQAQEYSEQFSAALDLARGGDVDGAKEAFEAMTESGPRTFRVMAHMALGAMHEQQNDLESALASFDEAADLARDPIMRDSAALRAAFIAAETQDFEAVQTRLQPLTESDGRLSYLAKELLAVEAWEAGNIDLARETLENLALAFDAPQSVQQRAEVALSVMGPAPAQASAPPPPSEGESK